MNFFTTSRKDDIISLAYNILFMLNDFQLPFYDFGTHNEKLNRTPEAVDKKFKNVYKLKSKYSLNDMIQSIDLSKHFDKIS